MTGSDRHKDLRGASQRGAEQFETALERQQALLEEAERRHRNAFATIRSIMRRTVANYDSVEEFAGHLEGRIDALCRVQLAQARDPVAGFDLATLIYEEMLACAAREGEQFTLNGAAVRLQSWMAESMVLAIHELATNAVKFGALAVPRGRVDVSWQATPRGNQTWLSFDWRESGLMNRPVEQRRRGFGTILLEDALKYDLGAEVERELRPAGLHCRIALPLPNEAVF